MTLKGKVGFSGCLLVLVLIAVGNFIAGGITELVWNHGVRAAFPSAHILTFWQAWFLYLALSIVGGAFAWRGGSK